MPILYQLFARGKKNKILEWSIEVDGNKYRTITGAQGAKQVESEWTVIADGKNVGKKNATTASEQAFAEATAKWEKKLKHGGYWEDVADIDKVKFVEPMTAEKYKEHSDKVSFPAMLDRKYNGMRQVIVKSGQFSRRGEPIKTAPHIFSDVKHLLDAHPDLVLDGELYNHDYRFKLSQFMKIVRKQKAEHITSELLTQSRNIVKYYVYDGYGFSLEGGGTVTVDTPCFERRNALKTLLSEIPSIVVVPFDVVHSHDQITTVFESHVDDGYEGSMVRNWNSKYHNERCTDLLKVKPEDDDECIILDIHPGVGNWSGAAKTATVEWQKNVFRATFLGEYDDLVEVLKNKSSWIGKEVTFLHIGYTGKSIPTAPKGLPFSPRIDLNNCFKK